LRSPGFLFKWAAEFIEMASSYFNGLSTKRTKHMKLYQSDSKGCYIEAGVEEIAQAYKEITSDLMGQAIKSPKDTEDFLTARLAHLEYESFACIYLDNRHRVVHFDELFRGTIDGTSVYPREVVKESLKHNAAAVILSHNHPSGVAEPSQADERITKRLKAALELVDIRVLDHIIIGKGTCTSFASRGLL
jgi:DNA repair protein RadC